MEFDGERIGPKWQSSVPELRWKVGSQAPPFVSTNTLVVKLLKDLVDGTIQTLPIIAVSEAVAVQIYRLISDRFACASAMKGVGARGLYIILASLAHGARTEPPDAKAVDRLRVLLGRPQSGNSRSSEPGLAISFSDAAKRRDKDSELRGLSLEEARHRLLLRLDLRLLQFSFGQATTAKATTNGGGDFSSASQVCSAARPINVCSSKGDEGT